MRSLHELGILYGTDKATHHKYCDFYEKELDGFCPTVILEIGVKDGASLRMWKAYYPETRVIGLDINPAIQVFDCEVYQCDATDRFALQSLLNEIGVENIDLIIDDGSHMTKDQQDTFTALFNSYLGPDGVYIMEDVHTSNFAHFKNSRFSTIEVLKSLPVKIAEFWNTADHSDSGTMIIRKR